MSTRAALHVMRRIYGGVSPAVTLLVAGLTLTVGLSWSLAATDATRFVQTSFVAIVRGKTTCGGTKQHAWGITLWTTAVDPQTSAGHAPEELPSWVLAPVKAGDLYETDAFGWPMRAVCRHRLLSRGGATVGFSSVEPFDAIDIATGPFTRSRLPIGPIWIGLGADTAFWGLLLGAVWFGLLALKRQLAACRGVCVTCGYDRRGLPAGAACPECGARNGNATVRERHGVPMRRDRLMRSLSGAPLVGPDESLPDGRGSAPTPSRPSPSS